MKKSAKTYAEKLRDPRWQRLRLEVLERSKWSCDYCRNKEQELQIHHAAYKKGAEPWEYKHEELICLCSDCHKEATTGMEVMRLVGLKSGFDLSVAMISLARGDFMSYLKYMCMAVGSFCWVTPEFRLYDSDAEGTTQPLKNFVKTAIKCGSK